MYFENLQQQKSFSFTSTLYKVKNDVTMYQVSFVFLLFSCSKENDSYTILFHTEVPPEDNNFIMSISTFHHLCEII